MIRTTLAASACGLALLVPGSFAATASATAGVVDQPAARAGSSITGTWKGDVVGDAGGPAAYPAKVRITQKKGRLSGKIVYFGYCRGVWKPTGKQGGWTTFKEVIKTGPCVNPVQVRVKRSGSHLKVAWREPISGDQSTMTASRA